MSSIDERVVRMEFDNKQFESGVDQTMKTLDELNQSLEFQNGSNRFEKLTEAIQDVDFSHMSDAIDSINARFSALGIVGMRVLQNLTDSAMQLTSSALSKVTGFVYEGLITRGLARAQNIEQARFRMMGLLKDTAQVQAIMEDVDWSVQNTAYGLDESALAASQFAASGLRAGDSMRHALRGIAGVAAMTNSEFSDIANIFTTVSGNGRVMGEQLLQLSSRGLNAAAILGQQLGKSEQEIRDMVSKGKISFEMFSEAMYEAFGEHATDAQKTLSGSFANARAAFAQIGQKFFAPFLAEESALVKFFQEVRTQVRKVRDGIGDFATFTTGRGLSAIAAVVSKMQELAFTADDVHAFFEDVISVWKESETALFLIGKNLTWVGSNIKANLIDPFVSAAAIWVKNRGIDLPWTPLIDFLKDFTPATVLSAFEKLSITLVDFLQQIRPTSKELKLFGDIFEGFFSAIDIGKMAFSSIVDGFKTFASYLAPYAGPLAFKVLEFFAGIGRAITRLRDALEQNEDIRSFFSDLANWLGPKLQTAIAAVVRLGSGAIDFFTSFTTMVQKAYDTIAPIARSIFDPIVNGVKELFASITSSDVSAFSGLLGAGGIMGIFKMLYDFRAHLVRGDWSWDFVFSDALTNTLKRIRSTFNEWQQSIKADEMIKIAISIAALALSLKLLAGVDATKLATGLGALTGVIADLFGAMALFNGFNSTKMDASGFVKAWGGINSGNLTGVIKFATAILILTVALKSLSDLDPDQAAQSVAVIGLIMFELVGAMRILNGVNTKKTKGFLAISATVVALSFVLKSLSELEPEKALQGIVSLGVVMLELAAVMRILNKVNTKKATGFVAIAVTVLALTRAVRLFGELQPEVAVRGLISVVSLIAVLTAALKILNGANISGIGGAVFGFAAAIYVIGKAAKSMGELDDDAFKKSIMGVIVLLGAFAIFAEVAGTSALTVSTAAGVVLLAAAVTILANAVKSFGGMSFADVGKGLVALGGSIAIMVAALLVLGTNSAGMVAGAVAVTIVAFALGMLVPVIQTLSGIDVGGIVKAIVTLAVSLAVLSGGLFVLSVLAPALTPVAAVIAALGAALIVFGAGLTITSVGLLAFVGALTGGALVITESANTISLAITTLIAAIIVGVSNSFSMMLAALDSGIHTLGSFILTNLPYILSVINTIILTIITSVTAFIPSFAAVVSQFIVVLVQTIVTWLPVIAQALVTGTVTLLNSVANGIRDNSESIFAAVRNILSSVIELVLTGLAEIVRLIPGVGDTLAGYIESGKDAVRNTLAPESFETMAKGAMDSAVNGFEKSGEELSMAADEAGAKAHESLLDGLGDSSGIADNVIGPIIGEMSAQTGLFGDLGTEEMDALTASLLDGADAGVGSDVMASLLGGLEGYEGDFADIAEVDMSAFNDVFSSGSASSAVSAFTGTAVEGLGRDTYKFSAAATNDVAAFSTALGHGNARSSGASLASSGASGAGSKKSEFTAKGTDLATGFDWGIASPYALSLARQNANKLANTALTSIKNTIRSASPSKETMKLGKYTSEGFAIGIKSLTGLVYNEGSNVGRKAIDGINESIGKMSKYLDVDIDYSPVIRPVMDLSEIQNGVGRLDRIIDNSVPSPLIGVGVNSYAQQMMAAMANSQAGGAQENTINDVTYNITLNYDASSDANQMARDIMREVKRVNLTRVTATRRM